MKDGNGEKETHLALKTGRIVGRGTNPEVTFICCSVGFTVH